MITSLRVEAFKRFSDDTFRVAPLTVLTGVNGGGKSSLIQALLLARLACGRAVGDSVELNGPFELILGSAGDVLRWETTEPTIRVSLATAARPEPVTVTLRVPEDVEALHLVVESLPLEPIPGLSNSPAGFTYLCAERLGPRDVLSVSASVPDEVGVGVRGEFTAQVLALREARIAASRANVRQALWHADGDTPLARKQTEMWLSEIIRPVRVSAQMVAGTLGSLIRFEEAGAVSGVIRPSNTGFGVSYALPIIVAGLLTDPGDVLIVENPEAHLHPAAQSRLGQFLARVAGGGAQVIVETHSDHVLNGARLAVARDRTLPASDVIVHFFGSDGHVEIETNENGELGQWPAGFFDQIENDLGGLARARRVQR